MSQILETLAKSTNARHVREIVCGYMALGDETRGILPEDGTPEDDVALLLPTSSAPLKEFIKEGRFRVEVRGGSLYWHDAKGLTCRAGSDAEPLDPRVLAAAKRPEGVLSAFVDDTSGAVPSCWIALVGTDLSVAV